MASSPFKSPSRRNSSGVSNTPVRSISINFIKETKPGEVVRIFRSVEDIDGQKKYFIEGKIEDKPCFCARIDF